MKKLRAMVHAPRYVAGMQRVYRAADSQDWAEVIEIVEQLHGRGLVTDMSRHWLGIAYLKLERWQDALDQYESIRAPLAANDAEARRILNHALSHYQVGDREKCANMLKEGIDSGWPALELRKAKSILAEIEAEH